MRVSSTILLDAPLARIMTPQKEYCCAVLLICLLICLLMCCCLCGRGCCAATIRDSTDLILSNARGGRNTKSLWVLLTGQHRGGD